MTTMFLEITTRSTGDVEVIRELDDDESLSPDDHARAYAAEIALPLASDDAGNLVRAATDDREHDFWVEIRDSEEPKSYALDFAGYCWVCV